MSGSSTKRILVYGGRGALGSACVAHFKQLGHWVCSVDIGGDSPLADVSVAVSPSSASLAEQHQAVAADVAKVLDNSKLDAVICVAGGWAGGDASSETFAANCDLVLRQSVWTSVIAAGLAAKHLASGPESLLVLTGAQPALGPTPSMIGYGMAKAAVHQMVRSLAEPNSGLPAGARTLALLPVTLDTPANRHAMGEASLGEWTPLEFVAGLIADWLFLDGSTAAGPKSGSLLTLVTKDFKTEVLPA